MRCCSISKMYLHNEAQFCAKTNVTSTANQFQFSSLHDLRFFVLHYLWSSRDIFFLFTCKHGLEVFRKSQIAIRARLQPRPSIKNNCTIAFDRIIFMPYCRPRLPRCQFRRPLNAHHQNQSFWDFLLTCFQTLNRHLPAASSYALFDGFGTRLSPASEEHYVN